MSNTSYQVEEHEKYLLIRILVDKLTALHTPNLKAKLSELEGQEVKNIIIDLKQVNYCDSSALSFILNANRIAKEKDGSMVICGLQKEVKKLIEISKLDSILNITPSLSEATDYLYMLELEKDLGELDDDVLS